MGKVKEVPRSSIPEFDSYEEEAAFWDTHSLAEFADELEPVEIEFEGPIGHILSVRLESKDFRRLVAEARARGTGFHALAERFILDALDRVDGGGGMPAEDGSAETSTRSVGASGSP